MTENRHQNIVSIANEVDQLIMDATARMRFASYIDKFCKMVEGYGQSLQPYIENLEKTIIRLEITPPKSETYLVDVCPPPKDWVKINWEDNRFINIDMGVIYRPIEPVNPLLWFGNFGNASIQRKPTDEESLMCEYVRLAVIHDYKLQTPTDKPIFSNKYAGRWFRRNEFCNYMVEYYQYANYATAEEKTSQLNRALERVKTDIKMLKAIEKKPWHKKTWTKICGIIVFLAALTTLLLNIDTIKERILFRETQNSSNSSTSVKTEGGLSPAVYACPNSTVNIVYKQEKQMQEEKATKIFAYVSSRGDVLNSNNFPWKIVKTTNREGNIVYIIDGRQGDTAAVTVFPDNSTNQYIIYNSYDGVAIKFTCPEEKISNFRIDVKY